MRWYMCNIDILQQEYACIDLGYTQTESIMLFQRNPSIHAAEHITFGQIKVQTTIIGCTDAHHVPHHNGPYILNNL